VTLPSANRTGIYIAYPTTGELKSIYRPKNYKTVVNWDHTKVGIAKNSFEGRSRGYLSNFDNEVVFVPIAIVDNVSNLKDVEDLILDRLKSRFQRVGRAREWFDTKDRTEFVSIIKSTLLSSSVDHELIDGESV
jgi:hypothetical protein